MFKGGGGGGGVAGRWLSDLVCLLHTIHGGIGPFTFVRFRSLLLIKS